MPRRHRMTVEPPQKFALAWIAGLSRDGWPRSHEVLDRMRRRHASGCGARGTLKRLRRRRAMAMNTRLACLMLLGATGVVALGIEPARADPCADSYGWFSQPGSPDRIPDCELQQQPTLKFDSDFSSGYAFYCSNDYNGNDGDDHAFFWDWQQVIRSFSSGQLVLHRKREPDL